MLKGVHIKFNFSRNLSRVDLKFLRGKEETIAYHLQFFPNFFDHPLFFNRFLKKPELCRRMVRGHFSFKKLLNYSGIPAEYFSSNCHQMLCNTLRKSTMLAGTNERMQMGPIGRRLPAYGKLIRASASLALDRLFTWRGRGAFHLVLRLPLRDSIPSSTTGSGCVVNSDP